MLGNIDKVFCARLLKQLHPRLGVEFRRGELGNKIVVVEVLPIGVGMMGVSRITRIVHLPPVPFGILYAGSLGIGRSPGGYRIDAPVDKDPKFRIVEPVRRLMLGQ